MRLPTPLEVAHKDICLVWGCKKPLRDEQGKRLGARGMCWEHLKRAQREGELVPADEIEKALVPCSKCRERPALWVGLCRSCYYKRWRQITPGRQEVLARDRERKRWNKLAKDGATSTMV